MWTEHQLQTLYPAQPIGGTELTTHELWQAAQQVLSEHLTSPNYHTWVRPTVLASCEEHSAVLVAPSSFIADHLTKWLDRTINQTLSTILGRRVTCTYTTLEHLTPEAPGTPTEEGIPQNPRRRNGGVHAAG